MSFGHGYRLSRKADVMETLDTFRDYAAPVAHRLVTRRVAEIATDLLDTGVTENDTSILSQAWKIFLDAYTKSRITGQRAVYDDMECELSVTSHDGRTYLLLHAEMGDYAPILEAIKGVEHWPWYDTENPPDGLSRRQWNARRTRWYGILSESGYRIPLAFTLVGPNPKTPTVTEIARFVPSRAKRASKLARDQLMETALSAIDPNMPFAPSSAMQAVMDRADWLRGPEGMKEARKLESLISAGLQDIDMDCLLSRGSKYDDKHG